MIPPGFISKVINYYTSQPKFYAEIDRAVTSFFDIASPDDLTPDMLSLECEALLNEWLIFDFQFSDGRTLLQHWIEENPLRVSRDKLHDYQALLQTNCYSLFETVECCPGYSITLRDIFSDTVYEVLERTASQQLQSGVIMPARVGQYRDDWYLVSADSVQFPARFDESFREYLKSTSSNRRLTTKDIVSLLFPQNAKDTTHQFPSSQLDRTTVEKHVNQLLHKYDIAEMVTVEQIQSWIYEEDHHQPFPSWITALVLSLVDQQRFTSEQSDDLIQGMQDLCNVSPRAMLDGRSPQEQRQTLEQDIVKPYQPDIVLSAISIGGGDWLKYHETGVRLLNEGKYDKSVRELKRAFRWLLQQRATEREIYRLFANAAIAHFANNQVATGKALLDCALELNPNYDFARRLMDQYETQQLPIPKAYYQKRQSSKDPLARHPAKAYMNWLRYLSISFKTKTLTTTVTHKSG